MKKLSCLLLALFIFSLANAQSPVRCSTVEKTLKMIQEDPSLVQKMANEEAKEQQWLDANENALPRDIVTIPTVVHIVYLSPVQNIPDNVVLSQIDALNQCYRKLNPDWNQTPAVWNSLVADCEVEFCLASTDPSGNPTNGITRTFTTATQFGLDDAVKESTEGGINAWPTDQYLNIWVCNLESGILGYAQLPTLFSSKPTTDGVVISYKGFGTTGGALYPQYASGKTAVHEVGHWLGLRHTWGDDGDADNSNNNTSSFCTGSDAINDTPNSSEATFGCPTYPVVDGCTNSDGKMFMNYMDYSDDDCLYMFTEGQKTKMVSVINTTRLSLKSSQACSSVGIFDPVQHESLSITPNPSNGIINVVLPSSGTKSVVMEVFNSVGQKIQTIPATALTSSKMMIDLSNQPQGIYMIRVMGDDKMYEGKLVIEK